MMILGALTGLLAPTGASASVLSAASGVGTFTINLDREAFAILQGGNSASPGLYNAHFYNTAESDYTLYSMNALLSGGGMNEEPSTALVHDITATGSNPSGQATQRNVQATTADFAFNSDDYSGTGALGMTGVQKYGIGAGMFAGYRMVYGDYSLLYNAAKRGTGANLSGWNLQNHIGGNADAYDIANLSVSVIDANNWKLTGDLLMSAYTAGMLGGVTGTDVGNFCLGVGSETGCGAAVSAVPVPGAVWLFGSGLAGLIASCRRKFRVIA
jgi:hypothetical protein